jgi:DNA (cytosine-5)-methyltransferase 1
VNDAICNIPLNTPDHDVRNTIERALPPWDGNQIAPRCITTSGGQNYHPSGRRDLTNREFAALQGFPNSHVFSGIEVRKQIGNAVPPPIAMLLFSHIKKHLEKTDGVEPEVEEPILVDDKADIVDDDGIITIDD